jgi:porin
MLIKSKRAPFRPALSVFSLVLIYIAPSRAHAQTQPGISVQPAPPSEQPPTIHPEQEPSAGGLPAPDFFKRAAARGLFFQLAADEELATDPSGGIRQGITGSQYLTFGADLDLQRLTGWSGGAFHAVVLAENSSGLSKEYIGGGIDVQENFAPFNLVRFLNFTIEQELSLHRKNDFHVIVGRMAVTPYFMSSVLTCLFMNHVYCGMMYGFTQSTGSAVAPVSSWGGLAKFYATPNTYVQFGSFAVDANAFQSATGIFDWGTKGCG